MPVVTHILNGQEKWGGPTPLHVYTLFADQLRNSVPPGELGNFADMLQALADPPERAARLWPDILPWLFDHFENWLQYDPNSPDHVQQWQIWLAACNAHDKVSKAHQSYPAAELRLAFWFGLFGGFGGPS